MKYFVSHILVMVALPLLAASQTKDNYTLKGSLPAYAQSNEKIFALLVLGINESAGEFRHDSCELIKGSFRFSGSLIEPFSTSLTLAKVEPSGVTVLEERPLWIEKGTIHIAGRDSLKGARIKGSPINVFADKYAALISPTARSIDSLYRVRQDGKTDSIQKVTVINPAIKRAGRELDSITKKFIYSNRETMFSLHRLKDLIFNAMQSKSLNKLTKAEVEEFDKLFGNLYPTVKSSRLGGEVAVALKGLKAANVGDQVVDFAMMGINGKIVDTRNLKGQVFLIDFWGSWCGWCRKGHPHLKELYERYKADGFEIVGVAKEFNTKEDQVKKWKKAVADDQIDWLHVLSGEGKDDLVVTYGVGAYPTKILVDRNGKILLRVTDDSERQLDSLLEELFKKKS